MDGHREEPQRPRPVWERAEEDEPAPGAAPRPGDDPRPVWDTVARSEGWPTGAVVAVLLLTIVVFVGGTIAVLAWVLSSWW